MRNLHDATQSIKYLLLQSLGDLAMRQTNTNALIPLSYDHTTLVLSTLNQFIVLTIMNIVVALPIYEHSVYPLN